MSGSDIDTPEEDSIPVFNTPITSGEAVAVKSYGTMIFFYTCAKELRVE